MWEFLYAVTIVVVGIAAFVGIGSAIVSAVTGNWEPIFALVLYTLMAGLLLLGMIRLGL